MNRKRFLTILTAAFAALRLPLRTGLVLTHDHHRTDSCWVCRRCGAAGGDGSELAGQPCRAPWNLPPLTNPLGRLHYKGPQESITFIYSGDDVRGRRGDAIYWYREPDPETRRVALECLRLSNERSETFA